MAETEGFEPSIPVSQYNGLANHRLQPLGHVSIPAVLTIARTCGLAAFSFTVLAPLALGHVSAGLRVRG
jgi:hypothetical protein